MIRLLLEALALLLVFSGLTGCQGSSGVAPAAGAGPEYHFKTEVRQHCIPLRATLKSSDISEVGLKLGRGIIDWMAEEGSTVASGDVVVRVDMDATRKRIEDREVNLATEQDRMSNLQQSGPAEMAVLKKNLNEKRLDLKRATKDEWWLKNPKTADEVWKITTDLQIASLSFAHAAEIFGLKKQVTDRGFDSPFALRTSEIELRSREIEFDYSRRLQKQLQEPPLSEELAGIDYQKQVASGEIWLAGNELLAASLSAQIRVNNLEVIIERIRSRLREETTTLAESVLKSPRNGIVIHPVLWGHYRFVPGSDAWEGVSIIQVIGAGGYFLESLADEADANMLVEKASATIVFDSFPGKVFTGEVTTISKAPRRIRGKQDSAVRFFPVTLSVNASDSLMVGGKASVNVVLAEKSGVFLPRDAVKIAGEKYEIILKTAFGVSRSEIKVEEFNHDWLIWKDAPVTEGTLIYP
ncbi:MAG TPA: hypothetical protein PLM07_11130 [Candidatus Rifleibacterium sp.]|nr:hypothetical protein [Candidatus Rifleibacterium sp.]HPT46445.1 hypothetical protein [Candidatus Rifleibacterium sp.]